jgi:hypothetical protein
VLHCDIKEQPINPMRCHHFQLIYLAVTTTELHIVIFHDLWSYFSSSASHNIFLSVFNPFVIFGRRLEQVSAFRPH